MRSGKKHFYSTKRRNRRVGSKKLHKKQKGGEPWTNPAKEAPGFPFENGNIVTWPGVFAANGGKTSGQTYSNYYPLSPTGINVGGFDPLPFKENNFPYNPPEHYTKRGYENQKGGSKKYLKNKTRKQKRTKKHMKGGFFGLGQNLINFGRDIKFRANSFYNDLMGTRPPTNPSPLDQPINKDFKILNIKPTNLPQAYKEAGQKVVSI